jgi:hypothetical protein
MLRDSLVVYRNPLLELDQPVMERMQLLTAACEAFTSLGGNGYSYIYKAMAEPDQVQQILAELLQQMGKRGSAMQSQIQQLESSQQHLATQLDMMLRTVSVMEQRLPQQVEETVCWRARCHVLEQQSSQATSGQSVTASGLSAVAGATPFSSSEQPGGKEPPAVHETISNSSSSSVTASGLSAVAGATPFDSSGQPAGANVPPAVPMMVSDSSSSVTASGLSAVAGATPFRSSEQPGGKEPPAVHGTISNSSSSVTVSGLSAVAGATPFRSVSSISSSVSKDYMCLAGTASVGCLIFSTAAEQGQPAVAVLPSNRDISSLTSSGFTPWSISETAASKEESAALAPSELGIGSLAASGFTPWADGTSVSSSKGLAVPRFTSRFPSSMHRQATGEPENPKPPWQRACGRSSLVRAAC